MYGIYQVRVDDTLDSIANEIGTSKEELMQINGIVKDMALRPGSFIIVPRFDNNYIKYKVKKGDNIYALAEKNNWQVKIVRMILDVVMVVTGVLLGGSFGVCTIVTIIVSGPVIQFVNSGSKKLFKM